MATDTFPITATADDGCRRLAGAAKAFYTSLCVTGKTWSAPTQYTYDSFYRFTNVTIPQGAVILNAKLLFVAETSNAANVVNTRIQAEHADNPNAVTSYDDYTNRVKTAAFVDWDAIPAWTAGQPYESPDIANVISDVIEEAWWDSGDALQIFWQDHGTTNGVSACYRRSAGFESAKTEARLEITWILVGSTNLPAQFIVKQGVEDLPAKLDVGQGSQELPAKFFVKQGSAELPAELFVMLVAELVASPASSYNVCTLENEVLTPSPTSTYAITNFGICDLPAEFEVGQGFAELFGIFEGQISVDLIGEFITRHDDLAELHGGFDAQDKEDLPAEFIVQFLTDDSVELSGEFEVRQDDSAELDGQFIVRHINFAEFLGIFEVQQDDSVELQGQFIVRQDGFTELLGMFETRHPEIAELLSEFIIRRASFAEISGSFDGQDKENLPAEFIPRRDDSEELFGEFIVRHDGLAELHAGFDGQDIEEIHAAFKGQATGELSAEFIIRHDGLAELHGAFDGQDTENLLAEFIVQHSDWKRLHATFDGQDVEELLGYFKAQATVDLSAEFIARHAAFSSEPLGKFIVRHSASLELPAKFISRHAGQEELGAGFWVRYYGADLLANIYIRPEGSTATDFQIKDLTRGLTIHDDDRSMTVTPQRKMKVK